MRISDWSSDVCSSDLVGARFGLSLGWVVIVGVIGICVFAEMSGRVAAISGRATFDLIRERLGPRMAIMNLIGSLGVTLLTFIAEVGGVAPALELVSSVNEVLIVPFIGALVWAVLWRSEEHTSELQSLMRISYAVFCLKKKNLARIDVQ